MTVSIMKTEAGIRTIRQRKALMLASTTLLLLLPAADGQKPEELTEHLHVTWVANWELHSSGVNSKSDSSDHITIELDATAHGTAPAGTKPWQMNPTITAYHYTVSGNGSVAMSQKDEWTKGSWTWALVEAPENPSQIIQLDNGSFSVAQFGPGELKIEPQGQVESGGKGMPTQSLPASLIPTSGLIAVQGVHEVVTTKSFYDQLSGTFDPNSKAFAMSGKASGSHSGPWSEGALAGSVEAEYSLNFNQQPEDVEAILVPQKGYERWMPQAGHDENTPGNGLLINVVLQKKDKPGEKPTAKAKSFKFELTGVSKEPGVCLNWPPKEDATKKPDFDLKIDQDANPSLQVAPDGQSATSTGDSQEGSVIVFSYDWGAWGNLKVTAELDNEQTVVAHLQNQPEVQQLQIPKDKNGNHIADAWEARTENQVSNSSAEADEDRTDSQALPQGDGLSLYEEYRGFMAQGTHVYGNPNVPDVFVWDENQMGTGQFYKSGVEPHLLQRNEIDKQAVTKGNPWVVNFNGSTAHLGPQHAIHLHFGLVPPGAAGMDWGGPGPPRTSEEVNINVEAGPRHMNSPFWMGTISHELGHAVNIWHHGQTNYKVNQIWQRVVRDDGKDEAWIPRRCSNGTQKCVYAVAARGGQNSGNDHCFLRYSEAHLFESDDGPLRWFKIANHAKVLQRGNYYGALQDKGASDLYCANTLGTGVNADQTHSPGNASAGYCALQVCANDIGQCNNPVPGRPTEDASQ